MPRRSLFTRLQALLPGLLLIGAVQAGVQVNDSDPDLTLDCRALVGDGLSCQFRLLNGHSADSVSLVLGGRPVTGARVVGYPRQNDRTAVMLVIDLGPDMPLHTDRRLYNHVHQVLTLAKPHFQFGLAAFVDRMLVISPVGVPAEEIEADLATLRSSPYSSSLYGVVREAINMLAFHDGQRRAILLMSNGNSADDGQRHAEIVQAANQAGISIFSLAYPTPDSATRLTGLRRLSLETGGQFAAVTSVDGDIQTFVTGMFDSLDSGGWFDIDTRQAEMAGFARGDTLLVSVHTNDRTVYRAILSQTTDSALPDDPSLAFPPPAAGQAPMTSPGSAGSSTVDKLGLMAYFVLGIGLLFIVGGILLLMRRPPRSEQQEAPAPGPGYLVHLSMRDKLPVELVSELISIGRNADNDIRLQDSSVSRHHAHIQRRTDGNYTITDLDSLNGIYINNRPIKSTLLAEGDELEIGDIRLRFTLQKPGNEPQPPTPAP